MDATWASNLRHAARREQVLRAKPKKKIELWKPKRKWRKWSEFQGILRSGSMLVMPEMQLSHATATTPFTKKKRKQTEQMNLDTPILMDIPRPTFQSNAMATNSWRWLCLRVGVLMNIGNQFNKVSRNRRKSRRGEVTLSLQQWARARHFSYTEINWGEVLPLATILFSALETYSTHVLLKTFT